MVTKLMDILSSRNCVTVPQLKCCMMVWIENSARVLVVDTDDVHLVLALDYIHIGICIHMFMCVPWGKL